MSWCCPTIRRFRLHPAEAMSIDGSGAPQRKFASPYEREWALASSPAGSFVTRRRRPPPAASRDHSVCSIPSRTGNTVFLVKPLYIHQELGRLTKSILFCGRALPDESAGKAPTGWPSGPVQRRSGCGGGGLWVGAVAVLGTPLVRECPIVPCIPKEPLSSA